VSELFEQKSEFVAVKRAIEEGKVVKMIKTWTGLHVMGNRRFHNLNITIIADELQLLNLDYPSDKWNTFKVEKMFDDIRDKTYEMLRSQALTLLAEKLGFESVGEMEEKAHVFYDDYGNAIVRTEDGKRLTAVFSEVYITSIVGKSIETYVFFKPRVVELTDC